MAKTPGSRRAHRMENRRASQLIWSLKANKSFSIPEMECCCVAKGDSNSILTHLLLDCSYIFKIFLFWIWVSMHTWHQVGLIKCILRPLKALQRAHLSWLVKLPGDLCSCLPVLQAVCDFWLLVPPSPLPVSPGHALSTLWVSDLLIDLISFQIITSSCSCVVSLEYLLQGFFSDSVPLIFTTTHTCTVT